MRAGHAIEKDIAASIAEFCLGKVDEWLTLDEFQGWFEKLLTAIAIRSEDL